MINKVALAIAIMAVVTYLTRVLPLILFKEKIKSNFIKSFLHYIPYTVLAAMTFPQILFSTPSIYSGVAGLIVALVLAFFEMGLVTVATGAVIGVLVVQYFM